MLHARERRAGAIQAIQRLEQRMIESTAVIRDQHAKLRQMPCERIELAGLLAVVAHEKLTHTKAFRCDAADADEKRAGAGAARKACGFGVEKSPLLGRRVRHCTRGDRFEQIARKLGQRADIRAAVPAMALVQLLRLEMAAVGGLDFLAAQPLLNIGMSGPRE